MSKNKPIKTVATTCQCGAKFDREVKRGRPQVWCPTCLAIPFYERTVATVSETGEVVVEAPKRQFDDLGKFRDIIEAEVAEFYAANKGITGDVSLKGLQAIYAKYR